MKRIDNLKPGTTVKLRFCGSKTLGNGSYEDTAMFVGIIGEGKDRRAKFTADTWDNGMTSWEAYRHSDHWAYGSSAEKLQLLEIL